MDLIAKIGGFTGGMDKAEREAKKRANAIKGAFSGIGRGIATALATIGVGISFKAVIDATIDAERAFALLDNAVKASGGSAGRTTAQLADMASELQRLTTFDDEAIQGAEQLLLRFRSIQGVNFDRALKSTLDLSTALGTDLESAAKLVGKALEDPQKGMTQLARSGVILSDSQKELVKRFVEAGDKAGAQRVILNELERSYGGAAEAARNTLGGALTGLKNAFGDLLEGKGGSVTGATEAINDLADLLNSKEVKDGFAAIISGMAGVASAAAAAIPKVAGFARWVGEGIARMGGPAFDDAVALSDEIDTVRKALENLEKTPKEALARVFEGGYEGQRKRLTDRLRGLQEQYDAIQKSAGAAAVATQKVGAGGGSQAPAAPAELEEIIVTSRKINISPMEKFYEVLDELSRTSTEKQLAQFAEIESALNELRDSGRITAEDFNERYDEALDALLPEVEATGKKLGHTLKAQATELGIFMEEAFRNTQDILSDGLYDAMNGSFSDIGKSFKQMLDRMVANALAAQIAEKLFGKEGKGGGWLDAAISWGSALFGGGKASGGPVGAGMLYPVNERGPELLSVGGSDYLMMGRQSGRITPNHQLAMAGGGVTQNIYVQGRMDERSRRQIALDASRQQRQASRLG
jgi:hypothetical protein